MTVLNGDLAGESFRIVHCTLPNPSDRSTRQAYGCIALASDKPIDTNSLIRSRFVVNGRQFNGTGMGYDSPDVITIPGVPREAGSIEFVATDFADDTSNQLMPQLALMPNYQFMPSTSFPVPPLSALIGNKARPIDLGGMDETWDAVDYQNVFLSMQSNPNSTNPLDHINIPSFHRPFLVNYWMHRLNNEMLLNYWSLPSVNPTNLAATNAGQFRRNIIFRPLPTDHPNFNGSNPYFSHPGFVMRANGTVDWSQLQPHPIYNKDGDWLPDCMDPDLNADGVIDPFIFAGTPIAGLSGMALASGQFQDPTTGTVINNVWDVDNDNDGINDSVWIDLGHPIQSTSDGRLFKPLYAIMCVDMDGRLNVNAHGMLEHQMPVLNNIVTTYANQVAGVDASNAAAQTALANYWNNSTGQGIGPAEVNLGRAFAQTPPNQLRISQLIASRLAHKNLPFDITQPLNSPTAFPGNHVANLNADPVSTLQEMGIPDNYATQNLGTHNYLNPPDRKGRRSVVLDRYGQPIVIDPKFAVADAWAGERINDPYEVNLIDGSGNDALYSVNELERLYRVFDRDMNSLPSRLHELLGPMLSNPTELRLFTTHSSDIRVQGPGVWAAEQRRDRSAFGQSSLTERIANRLRQANSSMPAAELDAFIRRQLRIMLPPDIRAGRRFDVNRPFGNGVDSGVDPDVIADDPFEIQAYLSGADQELVRGIASAIPGRFLSGIDVQSPDADGSMLPSGIGVPNYTPPNPANPQSQALVRQAYARYLYCMVRFLIDEDAALPTLNQTASAAQQQRLLNQRIAQWAINVVDFRDADSIMTPFEFDLNPFDGWNVDGNLQTNEGIHRRVIWGAEQPELLITETLAFHDRRVRDEENDDGESIGESYADKDEMVMPPKMRDDDLDQYRIPQGSLFIEMYCPRSAQRADSAASFPTELYNRVSATQSALDLARVSPAGTAINMPFGAARYPVWRIAIVKHSGMPGTSDPNSIEKRLNPADTNTQFDSFSFQTRPLAMREVDNVRQLNPTDIDRVVWFTSEASGADPYNVSPELQHRVFWKQQISGVGNQWQPSLVFPGTFAVAGPRVETVISSRDSTLTPGTLPTEKGGQILTMNIQRRRLLHTVDGTANPFGQGLMMICSCPPPGGAIRGGTKLPGEDAVDYSWSNQKINAEQWRIGLNVSEPTRREIYKLDADPLLESSWYYPEPNPSDDTPTRPEEPIDAYAINGSRLLDTPLDNERALNNRKSGTADVLPGMSGSHGSYATALLQRLADPTLGWNPEFGHECHSPTLPVNPYLTVDYSPIDLHVYNGEDTFTDAQTDDALLASRFSNAPTAIFSRERAGQDANIWKQQFIEFAGVPSVPSATDFFIAPFSKGLGIVNSAFNAGGVIVGGGLNQPIRPYPWLAWNNRPFASSLELLQVPASGPGRLLHEFSTADENSADPYGTQNLGPGQITALAFLAPHGHLMNFFNGTNVSQAGSDPSDSPNMAVLFDYLEVPSPYVGSQTILSHEAFNAGNLVGTPEHFRDFATPFNTVSRFRDPGRVNVNTINNENVWQAIDPFTNWNQVQLSRQGGADISRLPSRFANPFRASSSGDLMPLDDLKKSPADAGILRSDPTINEKPLFTNVSLLELNNSQRNSYFRYRNQARLDNLLTTRSNVYAVWITVGYFEVHPWNPANPMNFNLPPVPDQAHPDGYQLGKELGSDTGEIERHRAFYMLDRSIPVAYERGENHNVEDMILLRRFIE